MAKSTVSFKWQAADKALPADGQEVLIKCDDGFHVAVYKKDRQGFVLKGNAVLTRESCDLHWIPIVFP
jgi:hypothetical protein